MSNPTDRNNPLHPLRRPQRTDPGEKNNNVRAPLQRDMNSEGELRRRPYSNLQPTNKPHPNSLNSGARRHGNIPNPKYDSEIAQDKVSITKTGPGSGPQPKLRLILEQTDGKPVKPGKEWLISESHLTVGRLPQNDIVLLDQCVSRRQFTISDGLLTNHSSTSPTTVNNMALMPIGSKMARRKLAIGDIILAGDSMFRIAVCANDENPFSLTRTFPGTDPFAGQESSSPLNPEEKGLKDKATKSHSNDAVDTVSVETMMEDEFSKVVGHRKIKKQLKTFYKKVLLDEIRAANGRLGSGPRLFHMLFTGPPGTGKTSMANLVSRVLLKMGLVKEPRVKFVGNALELVAQFSGQTSGKVDAAVAEAAGGIMFIDEAYSVVNTSDNGSGEGFGREVVDTLMKHLDPPSCVFIFAGYSEPMDHFLRANEGMARRIPFRFDFQPYSIAELCKIAGVMCAAKGETLDPSTMFDVPIVSRKKLVKSTNLDHPEVDNDDNDDSDSDNDSDNDSDDNDSDNDNDDHVLSGNEKRENPEHGQDENKQITETSPNSISSSSSSSSTSTHGGLLYRLLETIPIYARETMNAGLISNLIAFSQIIRDQRLDIAEALENPSLAYTLTEEDLEIAFYEKLQKMIVQQMRNEQGKLKSKD